MDKFVYLVRPGKFSTRKQTFVSVLQVFAGTDMGVPTSLNVPMERNGMYTHTLVNVLSEQNGMEPIVQV